MTNVDNPQTHVTAVEWFYGYGGNHLGLKRVIPSLRIVAACEIEAYAVANVVAQAEAGAVDAFPVWSDCKTFPCESFRGLVDLFIASYPCQGFSAAGKRQGISDPIRPRRVFFENVAGHVSLGLSTVLSDLEGAGYRCAWGIFSAAEVGAPHQRKRVFILGELADAKHHARSTEQRTKPRRRKGTGPAQDAMPWFGGTGLGDSTNSRLAGPQNARADSGNAGMAGEHGMSLAAQAVKESAWPTPSARDVKGPNGEAHMTSRERPHMDQLPNAVIYGQHAQASLNSTGNRPARLQLNPDWVETLQGIPVGWTAYACSETEWSPPQPSEPGLFSTESLNK